MVLTLREGALDVGALLPPVAIVMVALDLECICQSTDHVSVLQRTQET